MTEIDACWSRIGIAGDHTCAELPRVIHCRNCAVFAAAARQALERPAPADYLAQWAERVASVAEEERGETLSSVVFRFASTHVALPTVAFVEAVEPRTVHAVPHRSSEVLLGIANIHGELQLCVSLAARLSLASGDAAATRPRLAVIEQGGERWAFPVDEIVGVYRIARDDLEPSRDATAASPFVSARFGLSGQQVDLLDAELVCAALRRAVA